MATSMARLPAAALLESELFSSSLRGMEREISGRFIHSKAKWTGVFPMERCFSMLRVIFLEPLTTAGLIILALFTSCLVGLSANGRRRYFIASETEPTAATPSAILFLTALAISMGLRVRVGWAAASSLS